MLKFTALTTAASRAMRTSSADSAEVVASGFSHTTCLPAATIRLTCGKWSAFGEVTWTTSTRSSASISSMSA